MLRPSNAPTPGTGSITASFTTSNALTMPYRHLFHQSKAQTVRGWACATLLSLPLAGPVFGQSTSARMAVTEVKPLLVLAVRHGQAFGVLRGEGAEAFARRFQTHNPIEIDVQRLHELPTPGCARLEVTTRQRGVREGTDPRDQSLVYQIGYCADGRLASAR
jgi:hypothetical protein